jgi:hypothetical protein
MANPTIRIHDLATNQVIDREMTDAEFAKYKADKADEKAKADLEATKADVKAAILNKLGITQEEAALLLGGN